MTSGVGLAGFSTRVRYLRVLNPILFDFIVPAVTTGPTFAFKRATMVSRGEANTNCLLSDFPAFFPTPRASSGCPAVAHSGCPGYSGTIRQALKAWCRIGTPNTDEPLYIFDLRDRVLASSPVMLSLLPGPVPLVKATVLASRSSIFHTIVPDNSTFNASLYASQTSNPSWALIPVPLGPESCSYGPGHRL